MNPLAVGPIQAGEVISYDGTGIRFEVFGDGEPTLVCLNGIACVAHAYWDPLILEFSRRSTVVVWDYRGHGASDPPARSAEIMVASFARDALAVVDAVGCRNKVVLVGHSMGVQVGLEIYRAAPERVAALVAVAGPYEQPLGQVYRTPIARMALPVLEAATALAGQHLDTIWRAGFKTPLPFLIARAAWMVGPRATRSRMERYLSGLGNLDLGMLTRMFRAMDSHSAADLLPQMEIPVLILAGGIDVLTPSNVAREMARRIPAAELQIVPLAGHALPVEASEEVNRAIARFISKHLPDDSHLRTPASERR